MKVNRKLLRLLSIVLGWVLGRVLGRVRFGPLVGTWSRPRCRGGECQRDWRLCRWAEGMKMTHGGEEPRRGVGWRQR